ncbi:hypothetical protein Leryth_000823 [Lithospermum erythrorhizon]|nr:hypothetical protein Leryth_000823 [Lithospermum erythrorhizon]
MDAYTILCVCRRTGMSIGFRIQMQDLRRSMLDSSYEFIKWDVAVKTNEETRFENDVKENAISLRRRINMVQLEKSRRNYLKLQGKQSCYEEFLMV